MNKSFSPEIGTFSFFSFCSIYCALYQVIKSFNELSGELIAIFENVYLFLTLNPYRDIVCLDPSWTIVWFKKILYD